MRPLYRSTDTARDRGCTQARTGPQSKVQTRRVGHLDWDDGPVGRECGTSELQFPNHAAGARHPDGEVDERRRPVIQQVFRRTPHLAVGRPHTMAHHGSFQYGGGRVSDLELPQQLAAGGGGGFKLTCSSCVLPFFLFSLLAAVSFHVLEFLMQFFFFP